MHEMSVCSGILDAALSAARDAGAQRINRIEVTIGELTEVIEDALQFAFDVLRKGTLAEEAALAVTFVPPRSVCADCGTDFAHGRLDVRCPSCGSYVVRLTQGREMRVDAIDID